MSEDMGPYYYSCPTEYLDMVPDPRVGSSTDWRAKVMWHYDHAVRPGSPCYNLPFSRCEGYQCASNRAALAGVEDSRTQEGTR